jgi:hypothetical protein
MLNPIPDLNELKGFMISILKKLACPSILPSVAIDL